MILVIGCDIAHISRIMKTEKFLHRFVEKHLTPAEQQEIQKKIESQNKNEAVAALATIFAAKESVSKALGTGFQMGITLKDIEITHDEQGCPHVKLYKNALNRAYELSKNQQFIMHITLSNEREYANAVAVLECK